MTLRDGEKAIQHATRACELTDWKSPWYFDTLAAAYAELGDYRSATEWQEKAATSASSFQEKEWPLVRRRLALYQKGIPYREHNAVEVRVTNDTNEPVSLRARRWIDETGTKRRGRFRGQELGAKETATLMGDGKPIRAAELDYTVENRWGTHGFSSRNRSHSEELLVTVTDDDVTNTKQIEELLRYLSGESKLLLYFDIKRLRASKFASGLPDADEFNEHSAFTIDDETIDWYESTDFIVASLPFLSKNITDVDLTKALCVIQGRFEDYDLSDWALESHAVEYVEGKPLFTYVVNQKIPFPIGNYEFKEIHIAPVNDNVILLAFGKEEIRKALANGPAELRPAMREFVDEAVSKYAVAARGWGTGYLASQFPEFDESDFEHMTFGVSAGDDLNLEFSFDGTSVRQAVRAEEALRVAYERFLTFMKSLWGSVPLALEPLETFECTRDGTRVTASIRVSRFVAEAMWEEGYIEFLDDTGKEVEERNDAKWVRISKVVGLGKNPKRGFRYYLNKKGELTASPHGITKEIDITLDKISTVCVDDNGDIVDTVIVIRPGEHEAAERIGFKGGDVLMRCNGEELHSCADTAYKASKAPNDPWAVEVMRDGEIVLLKGKAIDVSMVLLFRADNALADRTGVRMRLLIREVVEDSIGEELGIRVGDMIVEYDGKKCRGAMWFKTKRNKEKKADEKKELVVLRSGQYVRFHVPAKVPIGIHLRNIIAAR
jgi:hypothetical protein